MSTNLIIELTLNPKKKVFVYQGSHGKYYNIIHCYPTEKEKNTMNTIILNYDIHFPIEWADDDNDYIYFDEFFKVGPKTCYNCKFFGFYNGVFIGYCANCASLLNYERGNGLLPDGKEIDDKAIAFDLTNIKEENSMWNTYLKNIDRNEIGDNILKDDYEMYKDLPSLIETSP
jgi:hypothetical protein